ncbi:MAG: hypothetical protein R3E32_21965 [Chitinophagales bacterium]
MNTITQPYFDTDGHFTLETRSLYADAMRLDRIEDLPSELVEHLHDCLQCSIETIGLYQLTTNHPTNEKHPFFDLGQSVPTSNEELDDLLEGILRSALKEISTHNASMEEQLELSFKSDSILDMVLPKKDAVCIDKIQFELNQTSSQRIPLNIRDAEGNIVYRFKMLPNVLKHEISIDKQGFATGLYYWTALLSGVRKTGRLYVCRAEDVGNFLK